MKKQHKINRRTFLGNSAKIAAAGIIFNKLNATVINTEYKSIEESAFYIEKFLQQND